MRSCVAFNIGERVRRKWSRTRFGKVVNRYRNRLGEDVYQVRWESGDIVEYLTDDLVEAEPGRRPDPPVKDR